MPIIQPCSDFLTEHAIDKWHETDRFKNKETDNYFHPIQREKILLRVETGTDRAFDWLYNVEDAIRFNEYVGLMIKAECHEIILTPRCRLFYDVDLALDEFQNDEFAEHYGLSLFDENEVQIMEEVGKRLAHVFKEATLISLEEHGLDLESDLSEFDWIASMWNRWMDDHSFKISIHLITNCILRLEACSAFARHVKQTVIVSNIEILTK